jgi:hypothetical protein
MIRRDREALGYYIPRTYYPTSNDKVVLLSANEVGNPKINDFVKKYGRDERTEQLSWAAVQIQWVANLQILNYNELIKEALEGEAQWEREYRVFWMNDPMSI